MHFANITHSMIHRPCVHFMQAGMFCNILRLRIFKLVLVEYTKSLQCVDCNKVTCCWWVEFSVKLLNIFRLVPLAQTLLPSSGGAGAGVGNRGGGNLEIKNQH
jgi:hypothetical protein